MKCRHPTVNVQGRRSSRTQVHGLGFRRCGGGERLLFHMAAVPRPAGMTPEVRQQETVEMGIFSRRSSLNF